MGFFFKSIGSWSLPRVLKGGLLSVLLGNGERRIKKKQVYVGGCDLSVRSPAGAVSLPGTKWMEFGGVSCWQGQHSISCNPKWVGCSKANRRLSSEAEPVQLIAYVPRFGEPGVLDAY